MGFISILYTCGAIGFALYGLKVAIDGDIVKALLFFALAGWLVFRGVKHRARMFDIATADALNDPEVRAKLEALNDPHVNAQLAAEPNKMANGRGLGK